MGVPAILVMWPGPFEQTFVPASWGVSTWNLSFITAGDWDCVVAVERLPALHYSVDFIFLSFGILGFIVVLWNSKRVIDEA